MNESLFESERLSLSELIFKKIGDNNASQPSFESK